MDWLSRLIGKMLARAQRGMAQGMQEGMQEVIDDLMKSAFDPAKLAEIMKSMGIDISQLAEMLGQRPGFDPYKILGLDRSASDDEVKKRYHELLRKLHPDTAGVKGTDFLLNIVMMAFEMIKCERRWPP